jgi:hypothetical protein
VAQPLDDILLGVVANGVTAALAHVAGRLRDVMKLRGQVGKALGGDATWSAALAAVQVGIESLDLRRFASSPDFASFVWQASLLWLSSGRWSAVDEESLSERLHALVVLYTRPAPEAARKSTDLLLGLVAQGLASVTEAMSKRRSPLSRLLTPHPAPLDERGFEAIRQSLEAMRRDWTIDVDAILRFESELRSSVGKRHGWIYPPHVNDVRKVPIDDLYVVPDLWPPKTEDQRSERPIEYVDFVASIGRTVILGNPGGGKSTLSYKAAHDLAVGNPLGGLMERLMPIVVTVREYGNARTNERVGIREYIDDVCRVQYQVDPPAGAIEYLLLSGRCLVIFDGLDELLITSLRRDVTSDVELFAAKYPAIAILVTSREVGYQEAPLDESRFDTWKLAPFSAEKVSEYAKKWFETDKDLTAADRAKRARSFVRESEVAPDIRSNPLMLALMCNIYRGEHYIPSNRPDLYEKCANLLFDNWDKRRDIRVQLPFQNKLRPAMTHLAHSIYSDSSLQSGVPQSRLVSMAAEYLSERLYDDKDEAEAAANDFVEFCRGRAWVFTDVGTTPAGDHLYAFTHRTFLEFFTASYVVRNYASPEALEGYLFPRIARGEWDVVCQLAFQLLDKNVEGAGDRLLEQLMARASDDEVAADEQRNYLSFAGRCLSFLVPRSSATCEVTRLAVRAAVRDIVAVREQFASIRTQRRMPGGILTGLLSCSDENRRWVMSSLSEEVSAGVGDATLGEREMPLGRATLDLLDGLPYLAGPFYLDAGLSAETYGVWRGFVSSLLDTHAERVASLGRLDIDVARLAVVRGYMSLSEAVRLHGMSVVVGRRVAYSIPVMQYSILDLVVERFESQLSGGPSQDSPPNTSEIAEEIRSAPTPWAMTSPDDASVGDAFIHRTRIGSASGQAKAVDPDLWFCFAAFLAFAIEAGPRVGALMRALEESGVSDLRSLASVLAARSSGQTAASADAVRALPLSVGHQEWLVKWVRGDISLVATRADRQQGLGLS